MLHYATTGGAGRLTADELRALEATFGEGIHEVIDGGRRLFIIPKVTLPAGCNPAAAFGIYHASAHGGYSTRLFLEVPICKADGMTPPTVTEVLCQRTMYAASYNGVPADLPPHQGILAHLRLYEPA